MGATGARVTEAFASLWDRGIVGGVPASSFLAGWGTACQNFLSVSGDTRGLGAVLEGLPGPAVVGPQGGGCGSGVRAPEPLGPAGDLAANMSLQWTAVATFLYAEVFVVLLLCIPFISPKR